MRGKLLAFSMALLVLPWLGWRYLDEMQAFLLEGREQTQLLSAQALAGALAAHPGLFAVDAKLAGLPLAYAPPLPEPPFLDGHSGDWGSPGTPPRQHSAAPDRVEWQAVAIGDWLYLLVSVDDRNRTFKHPGFAELDYSDHLRLLLQDASGAVWRAWVGGEGPGEVDVRVVADGWRYPLHGGVQLPLQGTWLETAQGYQVELRVPLAWVGSMAVGAADVDAGGWGVVWATPGRVEGEPRRRRLLARSPAIQALLDRFPDPQGRATVVDPGGWVLAASGSAPTPPRLPDYRVGEVLAGRSSVWRARGGYSIADRIVAVAPVTAEGRVLGAVVIEHDVDDLLSLQWRAFLRITLESLGVVALVVLGLWLFASRLAWRIRRLSKQTDAAIDRDGRVRRANIDAEACSADELGGLSRHISAMLGRLQRFTGFLEGVPRTLRHELNNPLNVISTSLQNLGDTRPELVDDRYLLAAGRGVERMQRIVHSLTEAAGLEQSLQGDPVQHFDLAALVSAYVDAFRTTLTGAEVVYRGPGDGLPMEGCDLRVEQLLDKLLDNARDFTPDGGTIEVTLARDGDGYCLQVGNDGPPLPDALQGQLFDSMVSLREGSDPARPHLGIGLFVARAIAEHHGGGLSAANREDGGGVVFSVRLAAGGDRSVEL